MLPQEADTKYEDLKNLMSWHASFKVGIFHICDVRLKTGPRFRQMVAIGALMLGAMGSFSTTATWAQDLAPSTVPSAPLTSGMPQAAPSTPATAPASAPAADIAAISTLLKQADFWNSKGQPEKAIDALKRVLQVDPNNLDAIHDMVIATAARGDLVSAKSYLARFIALAPNDARIPDLKDAMVQKPIPSAAIQRARDLLGKGKFRDGIAAYRAAFANQPPPDNYAVEFYSALAGTPGGWNEAQEGLAKLYARRPNDATVGIAYGEVLTYRSASRRQGIDILQKYASSNTRANDAWRTALIWLIPQNGYASTPYPPFELSPDTRALYEAYYKQNPKDTQVRSMVDDYVKIQRDGQAEIIANVKKDVAKQMRGYTALKAGKTAEAIVFFREQLKKNPRDAGALGGMGMAYMRQKNYVAAEDYLNRAIKADPSKRKDWAPALSSIRFFKNMKQAQAAIDAGQNTRAEALLRPLANGSYGGDRDSIALASSALGSVLAEENHPVEAERYFRKALSLDPRNQNALAGLAGVLMQQNKVTEAQALMSRLTQAQRDQLRPGIISAEAQADLKRAKQLADSGDIAGANAAYSNALEKSPSDPWLRVEYGNFLAAQGNMTDAKRLVDPITDPSVSTPASLFAAAIFYSTQGNTARANELMNSIPAKSRTAPMTKFASDLALNRTMASAQQACSSVGTNSPSATASLRNVLATSRNLSNGDKSNIAQLLYNCGDKAKALSLAQAALVQSPKTSPIDYGGYIYVLLQSGRQADADSLIRQLNASARTSADRKAMAQLNAGVAARHADSLRDAGDIGGAYNTIAAAYPASPNDPQLLGALARVYQSNKQNKDAQRIYDYLLTRTPNDPNVLQGAALNQMSAGNYRSARAYLTKAIDTTPNDPRLYLLRGQIYKADDNLYSAMKDFEKAKALRTAQLEQAKPAAAATTTKDGKTVLPTFPAIESPKPMQKQLPPLPGNFFPAQVPATTTTTAPREQRIAPSNIAPTIAVPPISSQSSGTTETPSDEPTLPVITPSMKNVPATIPNVPVTVPSVPVMPSTTPEVPTWPGQGLPMQLSPFAT